ncbi:MAG: hypothetical protein J1F71_02315 [Clostridiales bacterium]|nr:hypothetical protein [Clostridiales bacterium]
MDDIDFFREDEGPTAPSKTLFFCDEITAIKAASPEGSTVSVVGDVNEEGILRAGYRVVKDNSDICLARGGEDEFAIARKKTYKKLIVSATHDYPAAACAIFRAEKNLFAEMITCNKPFAAVFDKSLMSNNRAELFGEIVALDLSAFDMDFCARMEGRRTDDAAKRVATLITELTDSLKKAEKDEDAQKDALIRAGKCAAEIVADYPLLLHASGAAQATEAYRMLLKYENRQAGMRGETEMLFGTYITDFYMKSLSADGFYFPPDNNKRIDSITSSLGADIRRACVHVEPIYPPQKLMLYEYRVKEFRVELMRALNGIAKRRMDAWQVFKRLYPDDGYCLKHMLDRTDAPLCIALAPDVFKSNSMLSFLKQTGKLEKYVI